MNIIDRIAQLKAEWEDLYAKAVVAQGAADEKHEELDAARVEYWELVGSDPFAVTAADEDQCDDELEEQIERVLEEIEQDQDSG